MADDSGTADITVDPSQPEDVSGLVDNVLAGIAKNYTNDNLKDLIASGLLGAHGGMLSLLFKYGVQLSVKLGKTVHEAEALVLPILAGFVAPMVAGMFGAEVNEAAFASRAASGDRTAASTALADAFLLTLIGDATGEQEPNWDGGKRIAGAALNATLEGWFQAAIPELLSDLLPADWLHFTAFTKLPEDVIRALGIGRLVRRVLTPIINATATTPLTWATNKEYRPHLLAEATALRAFIRGRWAWDDASEELARIGYNDTRQEELYNEQLKYLTPDDLADLLWWEIIKDDEATQTMRNQGYDETNASKHLKIRSIRREDAIYREAVTVAITTFVEGRISEADLWGVLTSNIQSEHERDLLLGSAKLRQAITAKQLSSADARAAVTAGILAYTDYQEALRRENYTEDAITVLDVLLRTTLDTKKTAAQHKADVAAEKTAAAAAKSAAAAASKQQIEDARALKQQGSIATLEHAVIVGLIPIDRLVQVLTPQFTPGTVQIYVADVTQKKAAYDAQQQQKADAAKRAENKGLPVGTLEQAVYDGIITLDAFTAAVQSKGLGPADAQILTATVTAKKADLDAAKQKRAAADLRAAQKKISLAKADQLVRLGIWSEAQYRQLLASLGFGDADQASLVELLESNIAGAQHGTATRAAILKADPATGLTLEQFRIAVKLGDKSLDQFQTFLVNANYTADQQAVLTDELRQDVQVAEAARLRRQQGDTGASPVPLSLSTATKAARLGIITPDAYAQRLAAAGYSSDDVAIEMELLTTEIAKATAATQKATKAPTPAGGKGLTVTQLLAAVKVGAATPEQYRAAAVAAGLDQDAVNTLMAQLADTLATIADAKNRRATIESGLLAQGVTLTNLEDQVRAGSLTVVDFEGQIVSYGYSDADAQLIGSLLENDLSAPAATP